MLVFFVGVGVGYGFGFGVGGDGCVGVDSGGCGPQEGEAKQSR